ncbi:hypothetical protein [Sphingomonas sp.]|jgi:hypothetical protein|uniref:hypothetical protein n=1 Tax=Sphingomonas sp. TaxID=28214 RepID=UPI003561B156
MNLQELYDEAGQPAIDALAFKLGMSSAYLSLIRRGHERPSPKTAQRMVACEQRLRLESLRPDIWKDNASVKPRTDRSEAKGGSA